MKNPTRFIIVQALYQHEITRRDLDRLINEYDSFIALHRPACGYNFDFYVKVITKVFNDEKQINQQITNALPKDWQMDRLDKVLLVLLRAASRDKEENAIKDYVAIAYKLLDKKTAATANAILDKFTA